MNFKRRKELTEKIGINRDKMIYVKIFEILNDNNSNYSYNKNGIFFDLGLNKFKEDTIDKLENFIYSIDCQDSKIVEIEKDRKMFLDKMKRELKKEESLTIKHPTLYNEEDEIDEIDYKNIITKNSDLKPKKDSNSKLPKNWENLNKIMKANKKKRTKDHKKAICYIVETELNEPIEEEEVSDIEQDILEHNSFSDTEDHDPEEQDPEEPERHEEQDLEEQEHHEEQEDPDELEIQEGQKKEQQAIINCEIILEQDFIE